VTTVTPTTDITPALPSAAAAAATVYSSTSTQIATTDIARSRTSVKCHTAGRNSRDTYVGSRMHGALTEINGKLNKYECTTEQKLAYAAA